MRYNVLYPPTSRRSVESYGDGLWTGYSSVGVIAHSVYKHKVDRGISSSVNSLEGTDLYLVAGDRSNARSISHRNRGARKSIVNFELSYCRTKLPKFVIHCRNIGKSINPFSVGAGYEWIAAQVDQPMRNEDVLHLEGPSRG